MQTVLTYKYLDILHDLNIHKPSEWLASENTELAGSLNFYTNHVIGPIKGEIAFLCLGIGGNFIISKFSELAFS